MHTGIAALTCAATLALPGSPGQSREGADIARRRSAADAALRAVAASLPGFAVRSVLAPPRRAEAVMTARRRADNATVSIEVDIASSDADAVALAHGVTGRTPPGRSTSPAARPQTGPMPEGSPSGAKVGQHVWRSQYPAGEPPRGAFKLIAVDGASLVTVDLMLRVPRSPSREAVPAVIGRADLVLAERVAAWCLDGLTAAGYTSRSAKSAASKKTSGKGAPKKP